MAEQEEYLTPDQAAEYIGRSPRQLERYVKQGLLTKYRRGVLRGAFYKRSELDALLEIRPEEEEDR